jgi:hypothetical protein
MPFPVARELPCIFHVIHSLHDLTDHIVHLNGLVSAGPLGAVFHIQNRLLEFPELVGRPI